LSSSRDRLRMSAGDLTLSSNGVIGTLGSYCTGDVRLQMKVVHP
jgi:hypothetical protein